MVNISKTKPAIYQLCVPKGISAKVIGTPSDQGNYEVVTMSDEEYNKYFNEEWED